VSSYLPHICPFSLLCPFRLTPTYLRYYWSTGIVKGNITFWLCSSRRASFVLGCCYDAPHQRGINAIFSVVKHSSRANSKIHQGGCVHFKPAKPTRLDDPAIGPSTRRFVLIALPPFSSSTTPQAPAGFSPLTPSSMGEWGLIMPCELRVSEALGLALAYCIT